MPTGTQQTIEGLLCAICVDVLQEPSYSDESVCLNCEEEFMRCCAECGDTHVSIDLMSYWMAQRARDAGLSTMSFYYAEDTGDLVCYDCGHFCGDCGNAYQSEEEMLNCCYEQESLVHNYSYRPMFSYYSIVDERVHSPSIPVSGTLYMGVEIEINKMHDGMVEDFITNSADEEFVYFKEDGSIGPDGVELVTMPATLEAFEKVFPFEALDVARSHGARSFYYANCGFHIHVARSAFSPTHMWKFIRFQLNNPHLCQRVAQRDESSYASWHFDESEKRSLPEYVKGTKSNGRRYLAINFQNHATVELRYFKGNILKAAILKNLEFVQSLYDYTKNLSISDVMRGGLTEDAYFSWMYTENNSQFYPNLDIFFETNENEGAI